MDELKKCPRSGENFGLKFIPNQSEIFLSFQNLYPHQTVSFRFNPKLVFNSNQAGPIQSQSERIWLNSANQN